MTIRIPESVLQTPNKNLGSKPLTIKQIGNVNLERLRDLTDATLIGALGPDNVFEPTEVRVKANNLSTLGDLPNEARAIFNAQITSVREAANIFTDVIAREHGLDTFNVSPSVEQVIVTGSSQGPFISIDNIASNVATELIRTNEHLRPTPIELIRLLPQVVSKAKEYADAHTVPFSKLVGRLNEGEFFERIIEKVKIKLEQEKEKYINGIKLQAKKIKERLIGSEHMMNKSLSSMSEEAPRLKAVDDITILAIRVLELIERDGAITGREKGHVKSLFQAIVASANQITQNFTNPYTIKEPESLDNVEDLFKWFTSPGFSRLYTYKMPQAEWEAMLKNAAPGVREIPPGQVVQ